MEQEAVMKDLDWMEVVGLKDGAGLSDQQIAERLGVSEKEVTAAYTRAKLAYALFGQKRLKPGALAREVITSKGVSVEDWLKEFEERGFREDEDLSGIVEDREFMRDYCETVLAVKRGEEEASAQLAVMFERIEAWYTKGMQDSRLIQVQIGENFISQAILAGIAAAYGGGEVLKESLKKEWRGRTAVLRVGAPTFRIKVQWDFIRCLERSGFKADRAARYMLGGQGEEEKDMVTIKELADIAEKSQDTVRQRIYKARDRGILKDWKIAGGVLLVNKDKGMEIARQPDGRGRPKKVT